VEAPQFALMMALEKLGPSSQVELGRRQVLDKTTVSRNLKLLERNGWIQGSVGNDRRERLFSLTAAGRKKLNAAKPEWKKTQRELRAGLGDEQWNSMFRSFKRVTVAAQTLHHDPDGGPVTSSRR
jgi:DNA-binding MarR family transcriptional regulator